MSSGRWLPGSALLARLLAARAQSPNVTERSLRNESHKRTTVDDATCSANPSATEDRLPQRNLATKFGTLLNRIQKPYFTPDIA